MENKELKSCPFCGGEATVEQWERTGYDVYCECKTHGCIAGNSSKVLFRNKQEAIKAWNTRYVDETNFADLTAQVDMLKEALEKVETIKDNDIYTTEGLLEMCIGVAQEALDKLNMEI